jgi:hypothetical protein
MKMTWINSLKVAIIEKDPEALEKLLDDMPQFSKLEEMESAQALLREANVMMQGLKDKTSETMKQLKKNMNFLNSTQAPLSNKLDIKS